MNDSINYVRKGGQLLVYAVYGGLWRHGRTYRRPSDTDTLVLCAADKAARVSWAPDTIFEKEITSVLLPLPLACEEAC